MPPSQVSDVKQPQLPQRKRPAVSICSPASFAGTGREEPASRSAPGRPGRSSGLNPGGVQSDLWPHAPQRQGMIRAPDPLRPSHRRAQVSAGLRTGGVKGRPGAPGDSGRPTSPAACSFAAHRPKSLETAWRGRRGGHEQRRGREGTSGRNGWRTGRARTGRDPVAPALPLPGREPALPSSLPPPPRASLRRADKGTRDSSNRDSRPALGAGGRSHAEPSLRRTHRTPVPALSPGPSRRRRPGLPGRPPYDLRKAGSRARPANRERVSGGPAAAAALEWPAAPVGPRVWVWPWACVARSCLRRRGWSPALREVAAEVASLAALRGKVEARSAFRSTA